MSEAARATRRAKKRLRRLAQEQSLTPDRQVKLSGTSASRRVAADKSVGRPTLSKIRLRRGELKGLHASRVSGTPAPENFIELKAVGDAITVGVPIRERMHLLHRSRRITAPQSRIGPGREVVSALMDNEGLGLRILWRLNYDKPTDVDKLFSGAKAGLRVFTPTMVRLAEFGLVEVRNTKLTRTARGNSVFTYVESTSGMNFKKLFGKENLPPEEKKTLRRILSSAQGAAAAAAPAPDEAPDPPQQEVEGYEEAMKDPNYRKYREEAPWLENEFGRGFVAYANGERVAFAKDMDQLLDDVSELLGETNVLIQEVPEKVVETSLPFHVVG